MPAIRVPTRMSGKDNPLVGFSERRITSHEGSPKLTSVLGFLAILRKTHLEETPDHEIVVAFDGENAGRPRQSRYAEYKANRAAADYTPIQSLPMVNDGPDAAGVTGLNWMITKAAT